MFTFILFGRRVTVALGAQGNDFVLGGKSIVFNAEDAYGVKQNFPCFSLLLNHILQALTIPIFGDDVVYAIPNDQFMEQKKFVKVGLSTDNLRAYVGMIEDEVEEFINNDTSFKVYQANDINEWGSFDVSKVMAEITILTASRTLQGKHVRGSLNKTFSQLFNDLDGGFTPVNFLFPNLPMENSRRRDRAHKKMSEFYVNIIEERRKSGNLDVSSTR